MEDYPFNLLIAARETTLLALPPALTQDIQAGIAYALSTLEEAEQTALDQKYRLGLPLNDSQLLTEKQALKKLCHPSRWNYICNGIIGYGKKNAAQAHQKGFTQGYREGYAAGLKAQSTNTEAVENMDVMDLPLEAMPLTTRVRNALRINKCQNIRDIAALPIDSIRKARNLGSKGIQEVLSMLHTYGLTNTEWELY